MRFLRYALTVLALGLGTGGAAQATEIPPSPQIIQAAQGTFREWVELLRLPNDATDPADFRRHIDWLTRAFTARGFAVKTLENGVKPMLYATLLGAEPPAGKPRRTVLFYAHYDGQPVEPARWHQASPWQPVLKARLANGNWQDVPLEKLFTAQVDPDWRVFARSSSDDKAPIVQLLAAIDALRAAGDKPAYDIKLILDSEEEKSSPSLPAVIERNRDLLKADAMLIIDGPMHPSRRPTLVFGNRGVLKITLKVFGPRRELHSGHFGNYAPNPAQMLASLLASMKDDDGRVVIPGFYDGIKIDEAAREIMRKVPDDQNIYRDLGYAAPEKVGETLQEALQYPSLNVRGLKSGDVGSRARTIIPDTALAEIDVRTVPEGAPEMMFARLKAFVEGRGYHIVDGEPTEQDRQTFTKLAALTYLTESAATQAVRTDLNTPLARWLNSTFVKIYGEEPVRIRMMGGTVPTGSAVSALNMPFAIVPLVNYDNNQHTHDENMHIGTYYYGVQALVGLLREPLF